MLTLNSFGFAKFFEARDSETCIRGFHRLGYEVGFARVSHSPEYVVIDGVFAYTYQESFNSRLKAEGDEASTNLYISNLPKTLTEVVSCFIPALVSLVLTCVTQELGTIFLGYTILSSKILRDSMGNSRGVGFAR